MKIQLKPSDTTINLRPSMFIAAGGEAEIYRLSQQMVFKKFKRPDHPDFVGNPVAQQAALAKIQEHKTKLPAFPKNIPSGVIGPSELGFDLDGLCGYTMPFVEGEVLKKFGNRIFTEKQPATIHDGLLDAMRELHSIVKNLHKADVIIGDFNDLNVLLSSSMVPCLIDADSMQFGGFTCNLYTETFVDPDHCDRNSLVPVMKDPHDLLSDWFAYAVMFFQTILWTGPYSGMYTSPRGIKINPRSRPLLGISVFDKNVVYPKPARPLHSLPDEILHYLSEVFSNNLREEFPLKELEQMKWVTCLKCGTKHTRTSCPLCVKHMPKHVISKVQKRGAVTLMQILYASGHIVYAEATSGNTTELILATNSKLVREGEKVPIGPMPFSAKYRTMGIYTVVGAGSFVRIYLRGQLVKTYMVDTVQGYPSFDVSLGVLYFARNGALYKMDGDKEIFIGDVLEGQTWFWVGPSFGFGFFQASDIIGGLIWPTKNSVTKRIQNFPRITGQIIDIKCVFSAEYAFVTFDLMKGTTSERLLLIIDKTGDIRITQTFNDPTHWSSYIGQAMAMGNLLFVPTDSGLVRIKLEPSGNLIETNYPDTATLVDSSMHLLPGDKCILVIHNNTVSTLTMS